MQHFNAAWSLYSFFQGMADTYALPLVIDTPTTATDDELLRTQDHWLRLSLLPGVYSDIQSYTVSCNLACHSAFAGTSAASVTWLHTMSLTIQDACLRYTNSATHHIIPIYDYDTLLTASAITTYLTTGTLPEGYETILSTDSASLPLYTPSGQSVGFIAQPLTRPVTFLTSQSPMLAFWSQAFQYFDPLQLRGSRG